MSMAALCVTAVVLFAAPPAQADDYFITDIYSGDFFDAEKTPSNTEDDLMCWAASASNILAWSGWGDIHSYSEDVIFEYYQDHWTDDGGLAGYGWEWWFDGTNNAQGDSYAADGWAQVDVPGGGFYPEEEFSDYFQYEYTESIAMSAVDLFLRDDYGISLGIYTENDQGDITGGHSLSVWGYAYDENDYLGLYVSDSDDNKGSNTPPDDWDYYGVSFDATRDQWFLSGYYDGWYIGAVEALAKAPYATGPTVPEPATLALFSAGLLGFSLVRRKNRNK